SFVYVFSLPIHLHRVMHFPYTTLFRSESLLGLLCAILQLGIGFLGLFQAPFGESAELFGGLGGVEAREFNRIGELASLCLGHVTSFQLAAATKSRLVTSGAHIMTIFVRCNIFIALHPKSLDFTLTNAREIRGGRRVHCGPWERVLLLTKR